MQRRCDLSPSHNLSLAHWQKEAQLAESYYAYAIGERNATLHQHDSMAITANWPCLFGEVYLGDPDVSPDAFQSGTNTAAPHLDGHKVACGVNVMKDPVVVYSFGSNGDTKFEEAVLRYHPSATVRVFDPVRLPRASVQQRLRSSYDIQFRSVGLGGNGTSPMLRTVEQIMSKEGHLHVDVLKVDVEGYEWGWLDDDASSLRRVGQLLVEVHSGIQNTRHRASGFPKRRVRDFVERVEARSLRLFHKEQQWRYGFDCCVELSFVQRDWQHFECRKQNQHHRASRTS
jgi:hypothetical protein